MKLLFTSVGRRVELIQAFRNAANRLNMELVLYGTDISDTAPALCFCNYQKIVCRIDDPYYIPQLLSICKKERIDALIPTIDTDLFLLSQNWEAFNEIGTRVIVSDKDKVRLCRDKRLTATFFKKCGLKTPPTVDNCKEYRHGFPCFIKPLNGSSSINAYRVDSAEDLKTYAKESPNYIIQPYIDGKEYTVDILCDFQGNPIYITPRLRLAIRGGEVIKTEICQDERIVGECKNLISQFKPCGAITVQLIRENESGIDYFIEINPRFGGGAPLSIKAGADSALAILRLIRGENINYRENAARNGEIFSRFDQSVCVYHKPKAPVKAAIFDIDDTLFSEKDYVKSGFQQVAKILLQVEDAAEKLWQFFVNGKPAIDSVLQAEGVFSEDLKQKCLCAYRNQIPDIKLYSGIAELLNKLCSNKAKIGILTDGRPEGQRAKIEALGLAKWCDEIIITDELGGSNFRKPCDIAFRIMQRKLSLDYSEIVYVGDNLKKDLIAPCELGMRIIHFHNQDGLYFDIQDKSRYTVSSISQLSKKLMEMVAVVSE